MRRVGRTATAWSDADAPTLLFWGAALASTILLLTFGWRLSFMFDDWQFLIDRPGWSAHSLLDPHNEHIVVLPVTIYKVLLATVGMDSAVPFRVVSTLTFVASVALLFFYLRERVDPWLALAGAALILFLGAAYEDLLWSFQIGYFGSVAAGLGMLLALERRGPRGDALACSLLVVSVGFSSLGLSFAAGALVEVATSPRRWRRVYLVAVPLLLYAVWWLGWGHTADNALSLTNLTEMPQYVADALAAGFASLLGLGLIAQIGVPGTPDIALDPLAWGRPLLVLALCLAGWRLHRIGRLPRWLWVVAAIGFSFWILAALNEKPGRAVVASRYQYVSAVFILLIAAELLRDIRVRRIGLLVGAAVTAAIVLSGISLLHKGYDSYRLTGQIGRADLAALEIARGKVRPDFSLDPTFSGTVILVNAGRYFQRIDEFGSPAYAPREISSSPELGRESADRVLAAGYGLGLNDLRAPSSGAPTAGTAPTLVGPPQALLGQNGACLTVRVTQDDAPLIELPQGGVRLGAGGQGVAQIRLRRFAAQMLPVDLGTLGSGQAASLAIPTDRSPVPWKLSLQGSGAVSACGL